MVESRRPTGTANSRQSNRRLLAPDVGVSRTKSKEKQMQKRKLGNSGLEVSAIGFGCMGLNFSYGTALSNLDIG